MCRQVGVRGPSVQAGFPGLTRPLTVSWDSCMELWLSRVGNRLITASAVLWDYMKSHFSRARCRARPGLLCFLSLWIRYISSVIIVKVLQPPRSMVCEIIQQLCIFGHYEKNIPSRILVYFYMLMYRVCALYIIMYVFSFLCTHLGTSGPLNHHILQTTDQVWAGAQERAFLMFPRRCWCCWSRYHIHESCCFQLSNSTHIYHTRIILNIWERYLRNTTGTFGGEELLTYLYL